MCFVVCSRSGPVDMFHLFKEVQRLGGGESVSGSGGWEKLADGMGYKGLGRKLEEVYVRYLSDFEVRERLGGRE